MPATQWKNHNRYRSYPFVEDANMVGLFGAQELLLPDNTLLDFALTSYLTEEGNYTVTLSSVAVNPGGTDVTFNFILGGFRPVSIVVSAAIVPPYEGETRLNIKPSTAWLIMRPIFGEGVADIAGNAANHGKTFLFDNLLLEPSTYAQPSNSLVTSISTLGGTELTGDVLWEEGYNCKLSFNETTNEVSIGAGIGAGAGMPCEAMLLDPSDCPEGVYYLNGRHPDWYGKFYIYGSPGIEVIADTANNKIIISPTYRGDKPRCNDPE